MKVNPPRCLSRTEVTLIMEITDMNVDYEYQMQYKQPHEDWEASSVVPAVASKVMLDDLNPSCSYHIRVMARAKAAQGEDWLYSEEVAVDTEVPGCTPEPTCCSCTIQ